MKKHYFKQKNNEVDCLLNRQLYVQNSIQPLQQENQKKIAEGRLSPDEIRVLKDGEEKKRLVANKEFSKSCWKKLKKVQILSR